MTTTAEPKTATIDYGCPDWCERTDHDADLIKTGDYAYHYGPEFGEAVSIMGHQTELYAFLDFASGAREADPQKLREIAANITLAAEWLEAHQ